MLVIIVVFGCKHGVHLYQFGGKSCHKTVFGTVYQSPDENLSMSHKTDFQRSGLSLSVTIDPFEQFAIRSGILAPCQETHSNHRLSFLTPY